MSADNGRLPVAISLVALLVAVVSAVAGSHDSSALFVVTSTSPGNQIVTLDPQPPATFAVPVSRPAGAVELAWTASSTAALRSETRYSVHRSPAGAGTYTQVASGLTTLTLTYTDTPGADGNYDYKVRTDVSSFNADSVARAGLSDRVAPTISGSGSPAANAGGWRNANTTVTFTCADGGSGLASCTAPVTVSTEGAAQNVVGNTTDVAGNSASTSVSISLDKTAPTISAVASPDAIWNGWRSGDVTVSFPCSDALSGVTCPTSVTITTEGANQSATATATDVAGNFASATAGGIGIDKSEPTAATGLASASGPLLGATTVELTWTAGTDTMSGVAGYNLHWVSALVSCPAAGATNYPNPILLGLVTSYSFTGAAATSYCFYLVTTDRVAWVSPNSAVTGPTLAQ